jgi:ketosteroid isomerase-like protein
MSNTDTVRKLLKIFETFNVAEAVKLFDKNASYQFGNFPPAVGIDQIVQAAASSHMDAITSCRFEVSDMIELGDGVIVCEMVIVYGTKDGRTIKLPCSDLFRFNAQGLVQEMKIYMDASPLFAPPAA